MSYRAREFKHRYGNVANGHFKGSYKRHRRYEGRVPASSVKATEKRHHARRGAAKREHRREHARRGAAKRQIEDTTRAAAQRKEKIEENTRAEAQLSDRQKTPRAPRRSEKSKSKSTRAHSRSEKKQWQLKDQKKPQNWTKDPTRKIEAPSNGC